MRRQQESPLPVELNQTLGGGAVGLEARSVEKVLAKPVERAAEFAADNPFAFQQKVCFIGV